MKDAAIVILMRCVHLDEDVGRTPNMLCLRSYIDPWIRSCQSLDVVWQFVEPTPWGRQVAYPAGFGVEGAGRMDEHHCLMRGHLLGGKLSICSADRLIVHRLR
jgi:hypothetical protein